MTSGQEGGRPPYGEPPEGRPPQGQPPAYPPPGQPPQGHPPQGYPPYGQPPPGYPPYGPPGPGYLPAPAAPSGWGPGAPQPVERPVTVRAGLGALIAALVLYAVSQVVTLVNWRTLVASARAGASTSGNANLPFDEESFMRTALGFGIALSAIGGLAYLLFLWFAWKGHNWARIVLWVLSGLFFAFGLLGATVSAGSGIASPLPFVTALGWFQLLFLGAGIVLLGLKPSNDWYRYRGWLRATGQPG
jgi:hypothetical protein